MFLPIRKKALMIGGVLAIAALFTPSLSRICQAAAKGSRAAHPCCQEKTKCGPQFNSENCCQTSRSSSTHSIPVPQTNPELVKIFPLLSVLTPATPGWGYSPAFPGIMVNSHAPPSFLAHHTFLC